MKTKQIDKYLSPEGLKEFECLAAEYRQNYILARVIGIETSVLYKWRKKYKVISDAFARGRAAEKSVLIGDKRAALPRMIDIEEAAYNSGSIAALQEALGVDRETINLWRESPKIDEIIKRGFDRRKAALKPEPVALRRYYDKRPDLLLWCDGRRAV